MINLILEQGTKDSFLINEKRIEYSKTTEFLVQIGHGSKGSYKTKYRFVGNLSQAILHYNGINLKYGYKKRLLMPSCSRHPSLSKSDQMNFAFVSKRIVQTKRTVLAKASS